MDVIDDFKIRFPEFDSTFVDDSLPSFVDTYPCYYGGDYNDTCDKEIILNLLAHLLYVSGGYMGMGEGNASPSSVASSKSVGSVSVSYAVADVSTQSLRANFFGATKYGQIYLILTMNNFGARFA